MRVAKRGNSLAVRLPAAVVKALKLKEGDQIEIRVAGKRKLEVARDPIRQWALEERVRVDRAVIEGLTIRNPFAAPGAAL
jgi:antitoxin MazE